MRVDFPGMPQRLATDPFGNRFGLGTIVRGLAGGLGTESSEVDSSLDSSPTTFATAPDGGNIAGCYLYDANSDCIQCTPGSSSDGQGGCRDDLAMAQQISNCQAANGTWANNTCTSNSPTGGGLIDTSGNNNNTSSWAQIVNQFSSLFGTSPSVSAATAAACTAAKGTWNGTKCVPPNSVMIGSTAFPIAGLVLGGLALFFLAKSSSR